MHFNVSKLRYKRLQNQMCLQESLITSIYLLKGLINYLDIFDWINSYSWPKFGPKMTKKRFQRKHSHIFFFLEGIQWNSDQKWRYSRVFWSKNLKPTGVFLVELDALHLARPEGRSGGRRPSTPQKKTVFQWIPPHRFSSSYLKVSREYHHFFGPSFTEYRLQK